MSLIAVDRIQNYYQYKDAEAKYYQSLKSESKEEMEVKEIQQPIQGEQKSAESKGKKNKKNKKSTSSENSQEQKVESPNVPEKAPTPPKEIEDTVKSDQTPLTGTAKKNAAKKKKQREKKAAAALAAKQNEEIAEIPKVEKPVEIEEDKSAASAIQQPTIKAKDKKKKPKSAPTEEKNGVGNSSSTLATEIAKAREHIKSSLDRVVNLNNLPGSELLERISSLEKDNQDLRGIISGLQNLVVSLEGRLNKLEGGSLKTVTPASAKPAPAPAKDDDDDVDLFGSDEEEDEEAERIKEERLKAYAEKKSKKPALIAKSSILLDVKPWDDETDMKEMEKNVRTIEMDGLVWGASKLVPLAYGIKKLQIMCVIEDEKVSVDELTEKIQEFEDFVQSVDIAAFNKI